MPCVAANRAALTLALLGDTGMKTDIHPPYYPKAKITCACGNIFTTGATQESMTVEICGSCHPFYTGKGKLVDTAGRVERFEKRLKKAKALKKNADTKKSLKNSGDKTEG